MIFREVKTGRFKSLRFNFGVFNFDSSELPVITVYGLYIPIFIGFIKKQKGMSFRKRFILPILSIIASVFIIFASIYAHGIRPYLASLENGKFSFPVLFYLIIFAVIMLCGFILKQADLKKTRKESTLERDPDSAS